MQSTTDARAPTPTPRRTMQLRTHEIESKDLTGTPVKVYTDKSNAATKRWTESSSRRRRVFRSFGHHPTSSTEIPIRVELPSMESMGSRSFDYGKSLSDAFSRATNRRIRHTESLGRSPIYRRQNCHGPNCTYCLSPTVGTAGMIGCAENADSGSSTDKEDEYPTILVSSEKKQTQLVREQRVQHQQNVKSKTGTCHFIPIISEMKPSEPKEVQVTHESTPAQQTVHRHQYLHHFQPSPVHHKVAQTLEQPQQQQQQKLEQQRSEEIFRHSYSSSCSTKKSTIQNVQHIPIVYESKPPSNLRQTNVESYPVEVSPGTENAGNTELG